MTRREHEPPGARLILWMLPGDLRQSIVGDLIEEMDASTRRGSFRARLWLWRHVIAIAGALAIERLREPAGYRHADPPRKGDTFMQSLWQDARYAMRMLVKTPGFTFVAVLTLALGIGANTAMFSVLNTYFFRALPYPQPDQIVRVYRTSPNSQSWPHSPGNFFDQREQNTVFEEMAAFTDSTMSLAAPGQPADRLQCLNVTTDFFGVLGVQPILGRTFTDAEEVSGADHVVVLEPPILDAPIRRRSGCRRSDARVGRDGRPRDRCHAAKRRVSATLGFDRHLGTAGVRCERHSRSRLQLP